MVCTNLHRKSFLRQCYTRTCQPLLPSHGPAPTHREAGSRFGFMFPHCVRSSASRAVLCTAAIVVSWATAGAQDAAAPAPAHIAVVDGDATVERDGGTDPATINAPFIPGDHVRTGAGRVEVLFADGTALDIDQYSAVDLQGPTLIRLGAGRLLLIVAGAGAPASAARFQIDTPAAGARTDGPG